MIFEKGKRNAEIEILRFVFAATILGIHLGGFSDFSYFPFGHYGVEFFFLLSGILMAQTYYRNREKDWFKDNTVGMNTLLFIRRKVETIIPLLLVILTLWIILTAVENDYNAVGTVNTILDLIPTVLMTPMSGAGTGNYGVTWYLSAMLLAMAILYPIYIKWNDISKVTIQNPSKDDVRFAVEGGRHRLMRIDAVFPCGAEI